MTRFRTASLFAALGSLLACSGAATNSGVATPEADPCPATDCLVGRGTSRDGAAAAEAQARARVAEQVASTITSQVDLESRSGRGGDDETARSRVRQDASFARAELIRVASSTCGDDGCRAVAVLRRADLADAMDHEYRRLAPAFRSAAARGLAAGMADAEFASVLAEAGRTFQGMADAAALSARAGRRPIPDLDADRAALDRLRAEQDRRLAGIRVTVQPDPAMDPDLRARLIAETVAALADLGLDTTAGGAGRRALTLDLGGDLACTPGHLGPVCRVTARGRLREDAVGPEARPLDLGEIARGADPRDAGNARAAALRKVDREVVRRSLGDALRPLLPVR